jgi:branched-chain amino acid transport system substrate-binding protein
MKKVSRRDFLKTSAFTGMALTIGGLRPMTSWGAEPFKIMVGTTFSGAYAETGEFVRKGVNLAVKEYGGKVLGRSVEIIERDVPNPNEGVRKAQEAVEKLGCKYLFTSPSSSTALAVMEYAAQKKAFVLPCAGSDAVTGKSCNKYAFRWPIPTWGAAREVVPRVIKEYNAKTFYTITPKYVFGEDLLRNSKEVLETKGCKLLGNSYHPLGESDFSSHLTKAMASKADCLLFLNFGGDTVNAIKQANNFAVSKVSKIACAWGSGITQMEALGAKAMEGVVWGLQYFYKIDAPGNKKFVAAYERDYDEMPPYIAANPYIAILALLQSVDVAGTDDTDAVAKAMEDREYEGLTGTEMYRACDHQVAKPYYTLKCKGPDEMKTKYDFADIIGSSTNLAPCEDTGCNLS